MDLSRFPRRRYTTHPTPLEPMPRFSQALAASCPGGQGPELWIKRDDMLGLFPGGNKTRKLEFLVADALAQGADTLITCGAPQSNHCRITLAAAVLGVTESRVCAIPEMALMALMLSGIVYPLRQRLEASVLIFKLS